MTTLKVDLSSDCYGQQPSIKFHKKLVAEGTDEYIEYKGEIKDYLYEIISGIKSGMSNIGAQNLQELQKKAKFIRITNI